MTIWFRLQANAHQVEQDIRICNKPIHSSFSYLSVTLSFCLLTYPTTLSSFRKRGALNPSFAKVSSKFIPSALSFGVPHLQYWNVLPHVVQSCWTIYLAISWILLKLSFVSSLFAALTCQNYSQILSTIEVFKKISPLSGFKTDLCSFSLINL